MKKTEYAYVAGIVDGEGSIGIARSKTQEMIGGIRYEMYVTVSNTNEWVIQWLKFNFGGSVSYVKSRAVNQKPFWCWRIQTRQAASFLRLVIPYLRIKQYHAQLALQFQDAKRKRQQWIPKTKEERELEETQYYRIKQLNKRGLN